MFRTGSIKGAFGAHEGESMNYEVNIRCAGTSLSNNYFDTFGKAKIFIRRYNPFNEGMNGDIISDIKKHGLSFGIWNKYGNCIYETDECYS